MTNISLNYVQLLGSYILYNYLTNIGAFCLFLLQFIDIRYYAIYAEKDKFREISKKLEKDVYFSASKYNNGRTSFAGYFIGFECIGYMDTLEKYDDGENIRILATLSYYKKLTAEKNVDDAFTSLSENTKSDKEVVQVSTKIRVYNRTGNYKHFYYNHISLNLGSIHPIGQQAEIVDRISEVYNEKKRATIFIHGVSSAGKSSIGYLLAKKYNGRFCHSFNPTDPGDQIAYLIHTMTSDLDGEELTIPIIVVIEEADCTIEAIHENKIVLNREVPTSVHNKSTWSTFLDDMIFYKNVILLLTSNRSKDTIDKLDPAYLRNGRINACYSMNEPLNLDDI